MNDLRIKQDIDNGDWYILTTWSYGEIYRHHEQFDTFEQARNFRDCLNILTWSEIQNSLDWRRVGYRYGSDAWVECRAENEKLYTQTVGEY